MKAQPNRLDIDKRHLLGGAIIDRNIPLRFRLDGRLVHGFEGDTVLSALIASGIDTVGYRRGYPIALGAGLAPPIAFADLVHDRRRALPMERTPALDGAEFRTLPARPVSGSRLSRLLSRLPHPTPSLGIKLDHAGALSRPWLDASAELTLSCDVVIVGGGVAGLSAALAAAHAGRSVILLESSPTLGGHARLFGTLEGEETPDHSITRLAGAVAATEAITVVTRAEAFAVRPGIVRAHVVTTQNGGAFAQVVDYRAASIILAPGAIERLPLFAGNRLPGIVGMQEAYMRAYRYGVWPGKSALFATVSSAAYRLAMLASDAGIAIGKIIDGRPHPQSRFIEFCKAYGITQSPGMIPAHAEWLGTRKRLAVTVQLKLDGISQPEEPVPLPADALIVCGGWQPDLSLWHMAGGQSRWSAEHARLEAEAGPASIALAGSAAGYFSTDACLQSGEDAIRALLGEHRPTVVEHLIDPIYETPDDPTPVSGPAGPSQPTAYLDASIDLIERPPASRRGWRRFFPFPAQDSSWWLVGQPQSLGVCKIAAGVQLGTIPAAGAGIIAQERAAFGGNLLDATGQDGTPRPAAATPAPMLPDFLAGRFGPAPALWTIVPAEPRMLEAGALIFINSDQTDPRDAIGVIVHADHATAVALIGKPVVSPGEGATLRDQGRPVSIRLGEPYGGVASAPALGCDPGPL